MEEVWKDIEGFEGKYQVSNLGRVKSVKRLVDNDGVLGKKGKQTVRERILKFADARGYKVVALYGHGTKRSILYVHRLVASAFINPKLEVNHIDGNKENNSSSNLEWVSKRQNMDHAAINGLIHSKLTREDIFKIKEKYFDRISSVTSLAEEYGVNVSCIYNVLSGKNWNHV